MSETPRSWIDNFPHVRTKKELEGKKLRVLSDIPPEPASSKGMYNLTVMDTANSEKIIALVTLRDVSNIVELTIANKAFTFVPSSTSDKWSEVAALE